MRAQIQKTKDGLLRTLLCQCLEQLPHLGPLVCRRRSAFYNIFGTDIRLEPWTWAKLAQSFGRLTSLGPDFRVAFFIDGLDEFAGDPTTLVSFIQQVSACDNVKKKCLSGRPWTIFCDTFGKNPSLKLEMLTKRDIDTFVRRQFRDYPGFLELKKTFPVEADQIVNTVVVKASGMFLCVSLVVQSLLAALANGDRLSDIQKTLDSLPEDV